MTRVPKSICQSAIWLVLFGTCISNVGCGGPNSVEAVPRTSSNQPVFETSKPAASVKPSNGLDLSFLHEDHFACVSINVQSVISNSDFADVPWDSLETQLAKLIGDDNSSIQNIERAWILVDRESLSFGEEAEQESPLVFVLDFKTIADESALIDSAQKAVEQTGGNNPNLVATKIGDKRIVICSPSLISKVKVGSVDSGLSRQLKQMKLDGDIDGLVDIGPVRSMLRSVFGMAATLGGEEFAKLSKIPDVLQRIELGLSLDSINMLQAIAYVDDDELATELANLFNASNGSGAPSPMGGSMPFGLGSRQVGGGKVPEMMITPTSVDLISEIGQEITAQGLFSIEGKDGQVIFNLERPSKLKELIAASLEDAKRQVELASRVENLKRIATALESYHAQYKCLPPGGVVSESDAGLPNQFNWRVGILPFLDEQALYDQFDFSKPWDSKENQAVAKNMPKVFAAVGLDQSTKESTETQWHVVGGKLGLYKGDESPKLEDIADRKIWTALVVEGSPSTAVNWTQPGLLQVDTADIEQFGRETENGILFLNAAFDPRIIKKNQQFLQAVLTPDGDEKIQRSDFLSIPPGK